ncbi:MAG: hypothetical protein IPK19_20535 [Chloroflexi bacterium]|nr:hypothetical protein [Chloroflexota bacterium]
MSRCSKGIPVTSPTTPVSDPHAQAQEIARVREELTHPLPRLKLPQIIAVIIAVTAIGWGVNATEARPQRIIDGIPALLRFVGGLLPPELEFGASSERAIMTPGFQVREIAPTPKVDRARRASAEEVANLQEGQRLYYVLQIEPRGPVELISPEEAANYDTDEVEQLRPLHR